MKGKGRHGIQETVSSIQFYQEVLGQQLCNRPKEQQFILEHEVRELAEGSFHKNNN